MANKKRLGFDDLPSAVERILEMLSAPESSASALPEVIQRITALENKIDYLQRTMSPESAMLDRQTVMRILKIRPKVLAELAESGVLPSRKEGRSVMFYEDAVVRYYMKQPLWTSAASNPEQAAQAAKESETGTAQWEPDAETAQWSDDLHLNMAGASAITGRSAAAIYQLTAKNKIPFHKRGEKSIYFLAGELREWVKTHPPRPRKK